ncbi:hypothetical protein [Rathayibacter sp. VKM Ac-2926]|uniref:hypothetical protein n=1 Tax=Rathayibacter sp. VKM Ac-2926 TaxID=2929477 RepID=UPI001FB1A72F|nr:hypothetical protein [Rathayibacter sp. VKM Ac-2926]MCJ1702428.1 hypothetical protein [Rathayibacter sp. VKM Ac-2926]
MTDDVQIRFLFDNLAPTEFRELQELAERSGGEGFAPPSDEQHLFPPAIVIVGGIVVVAAVLRFWRQKRGGQYIDTTVTPPRSWFDKDLDFRRTIVIKQDGTVTIEVDDKPDAWDRIVDMLSKLFPFIGGGNKETPAASEGTAEDLKAQIEKLYEAAKPGPATVPTVTVQGSNL